MQRSGAVCKAGESGQGAGETVPILGSASVGSVKPGLLFCDAHGVRTLPSRDSGVANFFSSAKRPSFLFMPDPRALKTLNYLDGWIARKTFDEVGRPTCARG